MSSGIDTWLRIKSRPDITKTGSENASGSCIPKSASQSEIPLEPEDVRSRARPQNLTEYRKYG